jgi:hypothetical protein
MFQPALGRSCTSNLARVIGNALKPPLDDRAILIKINGL